MFKLICKTSSVFILPLLLTACGESASGETAATAQNYPSHSEEEFQAELLAINEAESALDAAGWRFNFDGGYRNGVLTTTWSWNREHFSRTLLRFSENPPATPVETLWLQGMETYFTQVDAFVAKYEKPFRCKKNDGTTEILKLEDGPKADFKAKAEMAKTAFDKLKAAKNK